MSCSHHTPYRGRFAPSPSGDLHFGSLVAALGSYLDARAHQGQWLVRMEDIDPPREVAGASVSILNTLEQFGLCWDEPVVYQSQRHEFYRDSLASISANHACYGCDCTRKMIMQGGGLYQSHCVDKAVESLANPHSIRFNNQQGLDHFDDRLHGRVTVAQDFAQEDFILKRKDGLYAYQLVVVLDDIDQKITDIVRGSDLLEVTTRQMTLYQYLEQPFARYLHLPLAVTDNGLKLSKQNHAKALDLQNKRGLLIDALSFLGQKVTHEYQDFTIEQLLEFAAKNWSLKTMSKQAQIISY
ncbi:tRNA glutamyl-Q(34) synthetase GluQRS [Alteromonadales bacterium alter-6D02]|nr:tRNA glutamyl-Q(34) synthetase GluQRS [Alteromonadales bacterium alter-6D02]